jgi:hypothetical protein
VRIGRLPSGFVVNFVPEDDVDAISVSHFTGMLGASESHVESIGGTLKRLAMPLSNAPDAIGICKKVSKIEQDGCCTHPNTNPTTRICLQITILVKFKQFVKINEDLNNNFLHQKIQDV